MIAMTGNILQIIFIICNMGTIIFRGRLSIGLFYLGSISIFLAFSTLIIAFVNSDFSIQNVFFHSSTINPLIFKIAASWSSHEGSFLLWLMLLNIVSSIYLYLAPDASLAISRATILSYIQLLFACFIYVASNPFDSLSISPIEGLGLNPTLQDVALNIHPPILYLGNVIYVLSFTSAIIALIKGKVNYDELRFSFLCSKFALFFLTIGIGLGAWWAYRELGWGGYWFFDPVENISLFPWLSGIALHHSLLVSVKSGRFIRFSLILSILTFLLSILGTFLVRSGFLISVHSFASAPERTLYMFVIIALIITISFILIILRINLFKDKKITILTYGQKGIIIGNILWIFAVIILLISTFYPLVYQVLRQESISIEISYFVNLFIPIFIFLLFLCAIFSNKFSFVNIVIPALLTVIIFLFFRQRAAFNLINILSIIGSILLILRILLFFIEKKYSKKYISMFLSHFGFGLLALSITINIMSKKEYEFIGIVGDSISYKEIDISLKNIKFEKGANYYSQIAEFWVKEHNNSHITILKPENRFYEIERSLSQESDIYSYITYDLYSVLSKIDGDIIHAKIYREPMINFIWLSVIIMSIGIIIYRPQN